MMATVMFAILLQLISPIATTIKDARVYIDKRSQSDSVAALMAERVSSLIALIHSGNLRLASLKLECPAALLEPPLMAEIQAEAIGIAQTQEGLVQEITLETEIRAGDFFWSPRRGPPLPPCLLPDPLVLSAPGNYTAFSYRGDQAGIDIRSNSEFAKPSWIFAHSGVTTLP